MGFVTKQPPFAQHRINAPGRPAPPLDRLLSFSVLGFFFLDRSSAAAKVLEERFVSFPPLLLRTAVGLWAPTAADQRLQGPHWGLHITAALRGPHNQPAAHLLQFCWRKANDYNCKLQSMFSNMASTFRVRILTRILTKERKSVQTECLSQLHEILFR